MVDGRPGGAADRFWAELRALYEAAGRPTLSRLVRLGTEQAPPIKIADSTIDGWLTATSVPSSKHQRYVTALVTFLETPASKRPGYSPRPRGWFEQLLRDAREERAAARRAGRPRTARAVRNPALAGSPGPPAPLAGILLGPAGTVPRVGDIGLRELGVHPAARVLGVGQDTLAELPPYVPRDQDEELDEALRRGGLVIVEGRSAAGKSRAAAEALRRIAAERPLLVPRDGAALRALAEAGEFLSQAVVWLDDLERFLGRNGLDVHLLNRVGQRGAVVLATLRSEARRKVESREADDSPAGTLASGAPMRGLARVATTIRLPFQASRAERSRAERAAADPRIAQWLDHGGDAGLPEYLAAGPATVSRWLSGRDGGHLTGAALVSAAIDCRRGGYERPLSRDLLTELYPYYLDPRDAHRAGLPGVDDGFAWAVEPVHGASSCLIPQADGHLQVFDYLTDHAERDPEARPVPTAAWRTILGYASGDSLGAVVGTAMNVAVATGRPEVRDLALDRLGQDGGFDATFEMVSAVYLLLSGGDVNGSLARWVRPFADEGHPGAMAVLGECLVSDGQAEEGEAWLRRAAADDEPGAAVRVAQLLREREDTARLEEFLNDALAAGEAETVSVFAAWLLDQDPPDAAAEAEAERWLHRAAQTGNAGSMTALGFLHHRRGDKAASESWYRRAAELGEPAAMTSLGGMLAREGDERAEAERWLRAAAAAGHPVGQYNLALLLYQHGEREEPETLLSQAASSGYPPALTHLALLRHERGDTSGVDDLLLPALATPAGPGNDDLGAVTDFAAELARRDHKAEAERWYRRAAEVGHPGAMLGAGDLCYERADYAAAKDWYGRAAERGEPGAMVNLGYMRQQAGALTGAERWYERAAQAGFPPGMFNLGALLAHRSQAAEAENWYRRAAELGHVDAMYNLGLCLARRGDYLEARRWYQEAAQAGDAGAAKALSSLLARHPEIRG